MIQVKTSNKNSVSIKFILCVFILWLALIVSAFAVVFVTYDTRVKFNSLETLRREQNNLQTVWGQYLLEESTWAAYWRVESLAKEKLSMRVPDSNNIIMVKP